MPLIVVLVPLGVALVWALLVFVFKPLGKLIFHIGSDIKDTMSEEEFDEDNEDEKEDK